MPSGRAFHFHLIQHIIYLYIDRVMVMYTTATGWQLAAPWSTSSTCHGMDTSMVDFNDEASIRPSRLTEPNTRVCQCCTWNKVGMHASLFCSSFASVVVWIGGREAQASFSSSPRPSPCTVPYRT